MTTTAKPSFISVRALTLATGFLAAVITLVLGLASMWRPGYGSGFLDLMASVNPGYANSGTFVDLLVGAAYGFVDGGVLGWLLANLYNRQIVEDDAGRMKSFWAVKHHDGIPSFWALHHEKKS